MLSRADIRTVAEDLRYLQSWGADVANDEVRRGSSVLRRLLVEDVYGQAWRSIGFTKQPKLIAIDITPIVESEVVERVVYAIAAGAHFRGVQIGCMLLNKGNEPVGELGPAIRVNGYPGEKEFALSEFLSSRSGVVEGSAFSRQEVIQYIANVRGGVHLGRKQRRAEKKLVERLGKIENKLQIHKTFGLILELVAIGQALGWSDDAQRFIKRVVNG